GMLVRFVFERALDAERQRVTVTAPRLTQPKDEQRRQHTGQPDEDECPAPTERRPDGSAGAETDAESDEVQELLNGKRAAALLPRVVVDEEAVRGRLRDAEAEAQRSADQEQLDEACRGAG